MSRCLVLGVGSPVEGDDLAWRVLAALPGSPECGWLQEAGAVMACADRPGVRLVDMMRGYPQVVIVDAMRGGLVPGSVRLLGPGDLERRSGSLSSHGLTVAEALDLAEVLGELPPRLDLIGIEVGEGAAALAPSAALVEEVSACLRRLLDGAGPATAR